MPFQKRMPSLKAVRPESSDSIHQYAGHPQGALTEQKGDQTRGASNLPGSLAQISNKAKRKKTQMS